METIEVMREFPNLEKDIEQAEKEYRNGDYVTLEELLAKEGFVVAEKKKKYEISTCGAKKNTKRAR